MNEVLRAICENEYKLKLKEEPTFIKKLRIDLALNELEEKFMDKLTKEQRRDYEDIMSLHFSVNDEYIYQAFSDGFSMATKIMIDILR